MGARKGFYQEGARLGQPGIRPGRCGRVVVASFAHRGAASPPPCEVSTGGQSTDSASSLHFVRRRKYGRKSSRTALNLGTRVSVTSSWTITTPPRMPPRLHPGALMPPATPRGPGTHKGAAAPSLHPHVGLAALRDPRHPNPTDHAQGGAGLPNGASARMLILTSGHGDGSLGVSLPERGGRRGWEPVCPCSWGTPAGPPPQPSCSSGAPALLPPAATCCQDIRSPGLCPWGGPCGENGGS